MRSILIGQRTRAHSTTDNPSFWPSAKKSNQRTNLNKRGPSLTCSRRLLICTTVSTSVVAVGVIEAAAEVTADGDVAIEEACPSAAGSLIAELRSIGGRGRGVAGCQGGRPANPGARLRFVDLEGHQDPRGTKVSPPLYAYPHPGRVGGGVRSVRGGKPHFLKAPVKNIPPLARSLPSILMSTRDTTILTGAAWEVAPLIPPVTIGAPTARARTQEFHRMCCRAHAGQWNFAGLYSTRRPPVVVATCL